MPKFADNQKTTGGVKRRATKRLKRTGKIRGVSQKGGLTGREVRAVKRAHEALRSGGGSQPFNPLAPLTGPTLKKELGAAEKLQFGDQERELGREGSRLQQQQANVGGYWDDYKAALDASLGRIRTENAAAVGASEARAESLQTKSTTEQQARDAEASAQSEQLGQGKVRTEEGYRAIAGARSQAEGDITRMRERTGATATRVDLQGANSKLGKLQALQREQGRQRENAEDKQDLQAKKGAFRTDYRSRAREGEREWAAIQQEFGLKERELDQDSKNNKADRSLKRLELVTQRAIAKMYSGAKRRSAEAQIEVARQQLEGKKISRRKYVEILNRYQGLPGSDGKGSSGGGNGSGPGGSLLPWERDKISTAVQALRNTKATPADRKRALQTLQKRGIPLRLARIAWGRYLKKQPSTRPQTGTPAN